MVTHQNIFLNENNIKTDTFIFCVVTLFFMSILYYLKYTISFLTVENFLNYSNFYDSDEIQYNFLFFIFQTEDCRFLTNFIFTTNFLSIFPCHLPCLWAPCKYSDSCVLHFALFGWCILFLVFLSIVFFLLLNRVIHPHATTCVL